MPIFKVSKKADDDLLDIRNYTHENWGTKQRDKYLYEIGERFHLLAENPDYPASRDISHIKQGYFSLLVNEHVIIFRKHSYGVRIVRVLGQSMELKRHLT